MNKNFRYIAILAIIPLFTAGLTSDYFTDANALKSKGVGTSKYGASTNICGLQLCSEIPGGKDAWQESQKTGEPVEETIPPHSIPASSVSKPTAQPAEESSITEADLGSLVRLSRANVPATIPMHQGFYDGGTVHYIITDSSDPAHAEIITENQGWQVELAPLLANAPDEALSKTYMFKNGVAGDGVHGFQGEVFTSTPAQSDIYSALTAHVHVTWSDGVDPRILDSEEMIIAAEDAGEITLADLPVVLNMPQIVWPDGQMMVKEDKTLADDTPYGGGQVLDIDTEEMTVTFIAHRGWGPDGRTIYYIVTDATPSGPAGMMGVIDAPTSASLIANSAAVDLFQFGNGIVGSGPMGFQPGIAAGAPGDANYSPMWRIFMIGWEDPNSA